MAEARTPEGGTFTPGTFAASDGYSLGFRDYPPDGPARGTLVLLHGIQSHAGWYGGTCEFLRRSGWRVRFLDRRGSGVNRQARGDTPGFRRLLDDVAEFLRASRGAGPTALAGISWGGKLAAALPYRHPGLADAVALLCPGIAARVGPPLSQKLAVAWSRLVRPTRRYPIPLSDPALFTADPGWQATIATDPLALHDATARFLAASAFLDFYLRRARRSLTVPVLLMLAGRDRVVDNARLRAFVASLPPGDRTVIEYPEAEHTLEFEPDPGHYRADLLAWLDRLVG